MGIISPSLKLIIKEHNYKPLKGNLLVIGKQTVGIDHKKLKDIFISHGIPHEELFKIKKFDNLTLHGKRYKDRKFFFDHDVLKNISKDITYNSLDRSKYEGAKYIQDMNFPLNKKL